jgi:tetratricopeptide (TPR) repeat protein
MNFANFSNALPLMERQLKVTPDNLDALLNKGVASLQVGAFDPAIEALTKVLSIETNSSSELYTKALLSRAIAYLRSDHLDEAQRDYEALQKSFPLAYRVYYGLGDIAYRRKDTNAAIRNYQLYLTNSPANPDEIKTVTNRLRELQAPPR